MDKDNFTPTEMHYYYGYLKALVEHGFMDMSELDKPYAMKDEPSKIGLIAHFALNKTKPTLYYN